MEMEMHRIGEFAKLNGVSVQLLKYYDKHGILTPAWKDETGRYYRDYQSVYILEYRYLSEMGLSLDEARKLRREGNLADWCAQLSAGRAVVERKLLEQQALLRFVKEMQDGLEQIRRKAPWRIEPWEGGWFMPKKRTEVYPWGKDGQPILQAWHRMILADPSGAGEPRTCWGSLIPECYIRDTGGLDAVPGGPCFVYAHSIRHDDMDPAADFREPLKIMADNGLRPRGDLYQCRLCDTCEESGVQTQVVTRIPVRQQAEDPD